MSKNFNNNKKFPVSKKRSFPNTGGRDNRPNQVKNKEKEESLKDLVNLDYSDDEYEQKNPAKKEEIPVPDIQETDESFKLDLPEIDYSAISTKNSDKVDEDEEDDDESGELVMTFSGSGDDLKLEVVDDGADKTEEVKSEIVVESEDVADTVTVTDKNAGDEEEGEVAQEDEAESVVEDIVYPNVSENTEVETDEDPSDEPIEAKIEAAELNLMPEQPEVSDVDETNVIEVVDEPVVEEWAKEEVGEPITPSTERREEKRERPVMRRPGLAASSNKPARPTNPVNKPVPPVQPKKSVKDNPMDIYRDCRKELQAARNNTRMLLHKMSVLDLLSIVEHRYYFAATDGEALNDEERAYVCEVAKKELMSRIAPPNRRKDS